jgi:hypothetical protein
MCVHMYIHVYVWKDVCVCVCVCVETEDWIEADHSIALYKVVQIWPGQTVTCLHTISPGHIWTTLYIVKWIHAWLLLKEIVSNS